MKSLGLISEGITDQVVIRNILYGYFDTNDLDLNPLTPVRDATDASRITGSSGWPAVIEYVKSSNFDEAFRFLDYVILHLDTDACEEYGVSRREDGEELTPLALLDKVRAKFREWIGDERFERRKERILFAIAVDSIECWLLPLYYENNKAQRQKTVNCLNPLNQALGKAVGFTISAKNPDYYKRASEDYSKHRVLLRVCKHNPSLNAFIEELNTRDFTSDAE
jgi:hypothetical protein